MAATERVRVRGLTIHRPIIYGNTATLLSQEDRERSTNSDHTHRWTVAVRSAASAAESNIVGGADDIDYYIKRVTFKLHDTYPNPTRNVDKPPFEITETGWGEFEIQIRITFVSDSGEKPITFYHHLKLHPWTPYTNSEEAPPIDIAAKAGPVHSWQYDEVVFHDPFQTFLTTLTNHPPTSLAKVKRRPVPFHTAHPTSIVDTQNGVPEFTALMIQEETDRLEAARKIVIDEQNKLREILIKKENELSELKKEFGE